MNSTTRGSMLAATSTDKREIQVQTTQLVALVRGDEVGRGNEGKNDYKWRTFGPNLQLATSTTMTALAGNPNGPSWSLSVRCTSQPNGGQLRPRRHFGLLQADEPRERFELINSRLQSRGSREPQPRPIQQQARPMVCSAAPSN